MFRPVISYVLTSLILLSQVGLPLHMHYCKGMLESVSVLFAAKCKEREVPANWPACCKKALAQHCDKKQGKKCCDDEVMVLKQNITSTGPSFIKWVDTPASIQDVTIAKLIPAQVSVPILIAENSSDSGPPIFIMHHALIFYA